MRHLSEDEDEEIKDEEPLFVNGCKSSTEKDVQSENTKCQSSAANIDMIADARNKTLPNSTSIVTLTREMSMSCDFDLKNCDKDSRAIAIRENTFIANDGSVPSLPPSNGSEDNRNYQICNQQTQILLANLPPSIFDLKLSRYKRLNFDQIKTDLTVSRRGVFIVQALRWVSTLHFRINAQGGLNNNCMLIGSHVLKPYYLQIHSC